MGVSSSFSELLREAFQALDGGDPKGAAKYCRTLLSMDPKRPEGHFLVGLVASELKDPANAVRGFGSATKVDPDFGAAWAHLAQFHVRRGNLIKADAALQKGMAAKKHDAMSSDMLGLVASQLGENDIAVTWFGKAHRLSPDREMHRINYANALVYAGEVDQALNLLEDYGDAIAGNPQAQWILSNSRKAVSPERPQTLVARAKTETEDLSRSFLGYAAGKEFEDLEDWSDAAEAFALGAQAKRARMIYDEDADDLRFKVLTQTFTKEWLAAQKGRGCDDPSPLFVIGQPRTGTTLIERIITSHVQVDSAGELQIFGQNIHRLIDPALENRWTPNAIQASSALDPKVLGELYLERCRPVRGDGPFFVDKLPANFLNIPLILAAFPNAKIVHLTRDPRDTLWSNYKQLFAEAYPHSYDLGELARHIIRYKDLMAHWHSLAPGRIIDVSYEQTVQDLEPNVRRLISALQLDWDDACLNFHSQKGAVATASAVQVREKAHTRSVGRWRVYEAFLQPAIDLFKEAAVL